MTLDAVQSSVKDTNLVKIRREQIIRSAITLFKEKGFHKTTTREIAKESNFSIGTLYEYVRTKEDVLFLVYEAINDRVYDHLEEVIDKNESSSESLFSAIASYYRLIDTMQEEVVILYQEVKSLQPELKERVLAKEREMVILLKSALLTCVPKDLNEKEAELLANNVFVQGQMWSFRRWTLHKEYSIEEYIEYQLEFLKKSIER